MTRGTLDITKHAITGVAILAALLWVKTPTTYTQVASGGNAERAPQTVAAFEQLQKELSNWGRWGAADEIVTLNLITDAKRKAAAKLVKTGKAISLAHTLITESAPDLPNKPGMSLGPFEMTNGARPSSTASTARPAATWTRCASSTIRESCITA